MQLLSIFGGGLFIAPLLPFLAGLLFLYIGKKAQKSGYTQDTKTGRLSSNDPLPWYQVGQLVFAAICAVATVAILVWIFIDK